MKDTGRLRSKHLRKVAVCRGCEKPHTAHSVPFGDPVVFLITGWCEHCQQTHITFDSAAGDVRLAARQLADFFGKIAG